MKRKAFMLFAVFFVFLHSIPAASLEVKSGGEVSIDEQKEDLLVSGGRIVVSSNVKGDLIVAGGEVDVLGNVGGDLIASGGRINLKGDVGGKLIVAGGSVDVGGNVGKFVIAIAGELVIEKPAEIADDVLVFAGRTENFGQVNGNFTTFGGSYENLGSVKGVESFEKVEILPPFFSEILEAGFLVMGLFLLWYDSGLFSRLSSELRVDAKEIVKRTILGFIGIIIAAVVIGLLFISILGIPTALLFLSAFVISLLLANVFVAYSIGEALLLTRKQNVYLYFIIGFVLLFVAFRIPYLGDILRVVTTSLGFAAISYVFRDWRAGKAELTNGRTV